MPKLSGLDVLDNPLVCDKDFKDAIEYLNDRGIVPRPIIESSADYNYNDETIEQWKDLAVKICPEMNERPPPKEFKKPKKMPVIPDVTFDFTDVQKAFGEDEVGDDNLLVNSHFQKVKPKMSVAHFLKDLQTSTCATLLLHKNSAIQNSLK